MQLETKGKTVWEMLVARVRGARGNGAGVAFANPLDLRIGAAVPIAYANGAELAGYDFTVQEIREYNRHIGDQVFPFTDYVLRGVNAKSLDADDARTVRVRAVPNQAGACDALLLELEDEFGFAEDFLAVVKDTSGIFEITDDQTGAKATFKRLNELRESYPAAVLVVGATTPDGKAVPGKTAAHQLEYWDYGRDVDLGGGVTAKEFLFVEMNSENGWFQIWRGREFFR
jgi:hypothetical protein